MLYEFTHHFDRWRAELHGGGAVSSPLFHLLGAFESMLKINKVLPSAAYRPGKRCTRQ